MALYKSSQYALYVHIEHVKYVGWKVLDIVPCSVDFWMDVVEREVECSDGVDMSAMTIDIFGHDVMVVVVTSARRYPRQHQAQVAVEDYMRGKAILQWHNVKGEVKYLRPENMALIVLGEGSFSSR